MASRVIIIDAHRAKEAIPTYELKQMMGRVSRSGDSDSGKVDFIVGMNKCQEIQEEVYSNKKYIVRSTIGNDYDELAFHLMPEIYNNKITNKDQIIAWYSRTLSSFQGVKLELDEFIEYLKSCDSILLMKNNIFLTPLGKLSARYYFQPIKIFQWMNNFESMFSINDEPNDFAIAYSLASVGNVQNSINPYKLEDTIEEYISQASTYGEAKDYLKSGICWWNLIGGPSIRWLKIDALQLRKEWFRIHKVLLGISKYKKLNIESFLLDLDVRIQFRISKELVELCKLGFNKNQASELYNEWNVSNLVEIKNRMSELLASADEKLLDVIGKIIHVENNSD